MQIGIITRFTAPIPNFNTTHYSNFRQQTGISAENLFFHYVIQISQNSIPTNISSVHPPFKKRTHKLDTDACRGLPLHYGGLSFKGVLLLVDPVAFDFAFHFSISVQPGPWIRARDQIAN